MTQTPGDDTIALAQRLFDLARDGDTATLQAYLDAGAPVDMRNQSGDTMLTLAAYHEHPQTVTMLLEHGADIEAANDRGQRALTCAVFKGDEASARALLAAGADPRAGMPTAIETARMFGAAALLPLLEAAAAAAPSPSEPSRRPAPPAGDG